MKTPKLAPAGNLIGLISLLALTATPSPAAAEAVVPPGNSAANQYTEGYPTTGGEGVGKDRNRHRSPAKALGTRNAEKLEAAGPEGEAAAKVAAETSAPTETHPHGNPSPGGGNPGEQPTHHVAKNEPQDSSGLNTVLGQAIGSSSTGQGGLLAPLGILAVLAGSLVVLWKRKRPAS